MRLPGRAWLEFEVSDAADDDAEIDAENENSGEATETPATIVRQTAEFDPIGLFGLLYWYAVFPFHGYIFNGMLNGIATRAEQAYQDRLLDERTSGSSIESKPEEQTV